MENTDFVIEHIDEEAQVIADQPSVVTNYPANTDFFIENIDSNVISIAHSLNIEASEVNFRPANTDFFIENIDNNVISIAESMNLSPSEIDFRPANTDFFVENIDKNLIKIAESLSLTPYEVTIRPANTDMFIENIDKNVTLIKGSTNVVTVSGEYININLPEGGKVQSAQLNGNATQTTYSGKNLFDRANAYEDMALRWVYGDTYEEQNSIAMSNYATVTAGDVISTNFRAQVMFYASDKRYLGALQGDGETIATTGGGSFYGFTVPSGYDIAFFRLGYRTSNNNNANMNTQNIMVNFGGTVQPYEPYVGGIPAPNPSYPQPISVVTGENVVKVVGKNLLQVLNTQRTINGVTFTPNADGSVTVDGTATYQISYPLNLDSTTNYRTIHLPAGTYTISSNYPQSAGLGYFVQAQYGLVGASSKYSVTQFTEDGEMTVGAYIRVNQGATLDNVTFNIQLEKGSTATSYQAFTEQDYTISLGELELAKIGTYQDRIYKDGEKWYVEKQVGKIVYDGSENWSAGEGGGNRRFNLPQNAEMMGGSGRNAILSDYFNANSGNAVGTGFIYQKRIYLYWGTLDITASDFKSWLSTHPTTVYYALATPTTTEITNQTLIDQLEALASAALNQGVNNIFTEIATGNAMPTLELVIEKY